MVRYAWERGFTSARLLDVRQPRSDQLRPDRDLRTPPRAAGRGRARGRLEAPGVSPDWGEEWHDVVMVVTRSVERPFAGQTFFGAEAPDTGATLTM
jgi:hypothetical protein